MATEVISIKNVLAAYETVNSNRIHVGNIIHNGTCQIVFTNVPNLYECWVLIDDLYWVTWAAANFPVSQYQDIWYEIGNVNYKDTTASIHGGINTFEIWGVNNVTFQATSYTYNEAARTLTINYATTYRYPNGKPQVIYFVFGLSISGTVQTVRPHKARYTYSLTSTSAVKLYKALPIDNSNFNNVDLVYTLEISYNNGESWILKNSGNFYTKHSPLDYTKISPSVVNDNTPTVFAYSFTDINDETKSLDTSSITPIELAAGNDKFSFLPTTLYKKGETIILADILSNLTTNGKLIFADGKEILISSVDKSNEYNHKVEFVYEGSYFDNLSTVFVDNNTPSNFSIKLTLYTKYYGTLEYTYTVTISGETTVFVASITLTNTESSFVVGDRVIFGDNAELKTYNISNELLDTYTGDAEILAFLNANNYKGSFIGTKQLTMGSSGTIINVISHSTYGFLSDGAKTIVHKVNDRELYQHIFVSYAESELILTTSSASTGTNQNRLIVPNVGLILSSSGFQAEVRYHNNSSSGVTITYKNVTSTVTWAKTTITYAEAIENNNVGMRIQITDTYEGISVSAYMDIYVDYLRPIAISISGTDQTPYYIGKTTKFQTPNFDNQTEYATYRLEFNDGTFTDLTANQILNLAYRLSNSTSSTPLVDDTTDVASSQTIIWASLEYTIENGDNDITITVFGFYSVNRVVDTILSLEILNDLTFVLGNPYKKEFFTIKAIYASGEINNNFLDYTFNNTDGVLNGGVRYIMASTDIPAGGIVVYVGNQTFTLLKSKITAYTNPEVETVEIITNELLLAYNNGTDKINISNVQLVVSFVNALYKQTITFNASNTASTTEFSVQAKRKDNSTNILENLSYYNGIDFVNVQGLTDALSCEFIFSFLNRFDGSTLCSLATIDFVISAIQEIVSIAIKNAFADYVVGDTFLNENDDTQVEVYYKDSNGTYRSMTINLKSGLPSLSIMPQRGTVWKNIDNSKTIRVASVVNANIFAEYNISVAPKGYISTTRIHDLVVVWQESLVLTDDTILTSVYGVLVLVKEEYTEVGDEGRALKSGLVIGYGETDVKPYGYIDDFFNEDSACKVVEFNDWLAPIEGSPNQTINFPCYRDGNADLINKCRIGILFGSNNATNRLFVSGNPDVGNADWHTSEINTTNIDGEVLKTNGDFSYFTAESIMYYGETDNAVIGYDIVSNDKLLVLKSKSDKEKTVYFRAPTLLKAMDASGNVMTDINGETLYQEEYSLVKGNNSNAGISPHTIVNFNGDTLFVDSDNQIVGLDVQGIVGDNQRYANTRSKYIDNRLAKLDLSNAKLWTNNKYLFLSIPNYGIFVTHFTASNENQYEWWYLTAADFTTFIEINNVIFFGNDNGVFGRLFNGIYQDVERVFVGKAQSLLVSVNPLEGGSTIDGNLIPQNSVIIDTNLIAELDESKHYTFKAFAETESYHSHIFYQIAKMHNVKQSDTDLYIDEANNRIEIVGMVNGIENSARKLYLINKIRENEVYYLNYLADTQNPIIRIDADTTSPFINFGDKYKFVYIENPTGNDHFTIKKGVIDNGVLTWINVEVNGLNRAALCRRLDHECDIVDIDKENNSFRLQLENEYLDIVKYGDQITYRNFKAEISEWKNVEAYYIVAPMVMGNLNNFKTIWGFTLTNDTDLASELYVTYASNKIPTVNAKTLAGISKDALSLDFNNMDFTKADFDKNIVPRTYTIHRVLAYQKFVCFGFKNSNNTNAVLSAMSVTYTIPHPSYGSDQEEIV